MGFLATRCLLGVVRGQQFSRTARFLLRMVGWGEENRGSPQV